VTLPTQSNCIHPLPDVANCEDLFNPP